MIEIKEKEFLSGKMDSKIRKALENGAIIIFPSESSYGFGANCLNEKAVKKIHETKKESFDKPIGLVTDDVKKAGPLFEIGQKEKKLLEARLSGPLTILLKEKKKMPCSSNGTVGIRIPINKTLLRLCSLAKFPLTATSANIHGEEATFLPEKIMGAFSAEKDFIFINAGKLEENKPSTYYDPTNGKILREGKVKLEEIKGALSKKLMQQKRVSMVIE
ncbi:MAG: L-threonylcarbamoyladenylate synthase [Candidatus Diapherotrites archaeon]|nr:L-threonylcarbamoyladenylate synthase [Candidatus Diapherotrites archaeon]